MKSIAPFLLLLLLTIHTAMGSSWGNPPISASHDSVKTVLFEIRASEVAHVSYLFGTHHAFGSSFFDSLQNATAAFLSSQILIKENLNVPGQMAEDIINRRRTTTDWSSYLNKKDLAIVDSIFSQSEVVLDKLTPTELHVVLSRYYNERICQAKAEGDSASALDDYIGTLGEQKGLQPIGLETAEEQLALMDKDIAGMPRKVHKRRLKSLLERIRLQDPYACAQVEWYRRMDFDLKLDQPCQNSLLLTQRNDKWMPEIDRQLKAGRCFIAVGFSHLMFECGLISQLQALGYTLRPLPVY